MILLSDAEVCYQSNITDSWEFLSSSGTFFFFFLEFFSAALFILQHLQYIVLGGYKH